jgi:hypothetical protein
MAMSKAGWIDAIVRRAQSNGGHVDERGIATLESMTLRQLAEVEHLLALSNGETSLSEPMRALACRTAAQGNG